VGTADPSDLTDAVRRSVRAHHAVGEREARSRLAILEALTRLPAPLDRHADPSHVTGSAVVVGRRGVVLLVHRRLGFWMQPGGHLDAGETPWDAARRETTEETGLAARHPDGGPVLVHVDVHEAAQGHTHLDLRYLLLAADRDPEPPPGESQQVRWFPWDEAFATADASLRGALVVAQPLARSLLER
jgi:8-oxo-dGTP pyrophosphatase MutT (NUDIX family)